MSTSGFKTRQFIISHHDHPIKLFQLSHINHTTSMAVVPRGITSINWNLGNIANHWSEYLDYIIPAPMPIDENPALKSIPRWTAVQQPEAALVSRFACLDPSLP